MTATNHALSGALIGAFLPLPIAIPVAFCSHFVLDMLPHYGIPYKKRNMSFSYHFTVFTDTFVALSIAAIAIVFRKWNMEIAGWVAYSPDATWVFHYFKHERNFELKPMNKFMHFHKALQKYETPWGIRVDLLATFIMLPIFIYQLLK